MVWYATSFEKTNQTAVLNTPDLPSLVNSIRTVCSFVSSILGNASNVNGETTPSLSSAAATPAATSSSAAAAVVDASFVGRFVVGTAVALVGAWLL